jgi:hypothetical protein
VSFFAAACRGSATDHTDNTDVKRLAGLALLLIFTGIHGMGAGGAQLVEDRPRTTTDDTDTRFLL